MRIMSELATILFMLTVTVNVFAAVEGLSGVRGKIFHVNAQNNSFELLKETVFDPITDEGKSRHTVYWTDQTRFTKVIRQNNFRGLEGPVIAVFHSLKEVTATSIANGEPFSTKFVTVLSDSEKATGLAKDRKSFVGWFTPDPASEKARSGSVDIGGKAVTASLPGPRAEVDVHTLVNAETIEKGFWGTTIHGKEIDGRFVIESMEIYPLPDPRTVDDPKLPRVLVVGDSISMNYHDAAKTALEGVANYYRIEGNGGPSDRGVINMELWLGDYTRKGLHWDVIQFNHGLHDLKQPYDKDNDTWGNHQVAIEDYKKNLEKEIQILKRTGAKLIWCSTSPVPNSSHGAYARRKGEAIVFNKAAMDVISKYPEIQVNDLHKVVSEAKMLDPWRKGTDVHFWDRKLQTVLGNAVADAVTKALKSRTTASGQK